MGIVRHRMQEPFSPLMGNVFYQKMADDASRLRMNNFLGDPETERRAKLLLTWAEDRPDMPREFEEEK